MNHFCRYAIYYLPPAASLLYSIGAKWLAHDSELNAELYPPTARMPDSFWRRITESPRRYRFHATLKPPFQLARACTPEQLKAIARELAEHYRPFFGPPLRLARLGNFAALVLSQPCPELQALADDCVRSFDPFRMPPGQEEIKRRSNGRLSEHELANIRRWGYPYVFSEWKFHMTLTSSIPEEDWLLAEPELEHLVQPLAGECLAVDSICLFAEPEPNSPFQLIERFPFRP